MLGGERLPNRLEVFARVKSLGDRSDVLAERLAVAQVGGLGQLIDLRAGIVDVVLARDRISGEGEQIGQRVTEHGPAAVADVHGAGRIGGDILDIDRLATSEVAAAVVRPRRDGGPQLVEPCLACQGQVDEARTGDRDVFQQRIALECRGNRFRQIPRLLAGLLRQDHGGIGRHVAVGRIARRLDQHARAVEYRAEGRLPRSIARARHARDQARAQRCSWLLPTSPCDGCPYHLRHVRHYRTGHPRLASVTRGKNDVDGRDQPGHDGDGAPLTQFRSGVKILGMLGEREGVGHAGNEIADPARAPVLVGRR